MPWAGTPNTSLDGKIVRRSEGAIRALGTLVARKIRSPKGVNVYTSNQRSRRLCDRAAMEMIVRIHIAQKNKLKLKLEGTLNYHNFALDHSNGKGTAVYHDGHWSFLRLGCDQRIF